MKVDICNPYVVKIVIAARPVDSIRAISKRIGLSYGWTYKWAVELEKTGMFRRSGKKVFLDERNGFYRKMVGFIRAAFGGDVTFRYMALGLFGVTYCFTATDAVVVWTDGGYNIARYRRHYPIFIKVRAADREVFEFCSRKLGGGNVFYKPVFLEDFPVAVHKGMPVDSLEDTIQFMKRYVYNFQPALEMVQEMYGKSLGVRYREVPHD